MNIGNPHELPVLDIAESIRDLAGAILRDRLHPPARGRPEVRQPDISLARIGAVLATTDIDRGGPAADHRARLAATLDPPALAPASGRP